jgi:multicomponent K+:H+ antiporter subunit E
VKRLLPSPLLSLALLATWLMLNESASAGHLLLGVALAVVLPWFTERWRPDKARLSRIDVALRLGLHVLVDIVKSNLVVARRILGPERLITPRFVWVPLTLRDPHAIVVLAGIVTMTPGTLSADLSDDRRHLLVHAFDVDDDAGEAALVADIQQRYEAPLKLIFESGEHA